MILPALSRSSGRRSVAVLMGSPDDERVRHDRHGALPQGEREEARLAYLDVDSLRLFRMKEIIAMAGFSGVST